MIANYGSKSLANDQKKRQDTLVWNKIEKLLLPAESDVLEIFDWWALFERRRDTD